MHLELANDMLVVIEAAVNVAYGYDIRGEVLGETGTIELAETSPIVVKREGRHSGSVPEDWRERFLRAYDIEFQEWINAVAGGQLDRPQLVGRLRGRGGHRRLRRGLPHGSEDCRCRMPDEPALTRREQ